MKDDRQLVPIAFARVIDAGIAIAEPIERARDTTIGILEQVLVDRPLASDRHQIGRVGARYLVTRELNRDAGAPLNVDLEVHSVTTLQDIDRVARFHLVVSELAQLGLVVRQLLLDIGLVVSLSLGQSKSIQSGAIQR